MRARLDSLVAAAIATNAAVGAYTCYDLATADALIAGAERAGLPVVLLVPPTVAKRERGMQFITALRGMADGSTAEVVVQLDHANDAELIIRATNAGADAVLADGSQASFAENAAFVRDVRARLPRDVIVEAELGALAGDEDRAVAHDDAEATLTDPAEAKRFIEATGAQLLAVAIGNVHGAYRGEPRIDHDRLEQIRQRIDTPLVLHGASGIPERDLLAAITRGVGKVNINTELRGRMLDVLSAELADARRAGDDVAALAASLAESTTAFVAESLTLLRGPAPYSESPRL